MSFASVGMVICRGQLGLGVLLVALPPLGHHLRFGVQSFLGSDSGPGLC